MKKIRAGLGFLFGVSFHLGEDKDNRKRFTAKGLPGDWDWMITQDWDIVLVYHVSGHDFPMHVLGTEQTKGCGVMLEVGIGESVVYDPLECTLWVISDDELSDYEDV